MIEKKIIRDKSVAYSVSEFIRKELNDVPIDNVKFENTPMGERITIATSTPGLIIGREGSNIRKLTVSIKNRFKFENPQVKISEIKKPYLSAQIVAKEIANNLSRFGPQRFKLTGFKAISSIMDSGAMGAEIRITGKIPSSRAKSWRFNKGYLKKTGYVSDFIVDKAIETVTLKTGVVGIRVEIMLPETALPDKILHHEEQTKNLEEVIDEKEVEKIEKAIEENSKEEKEMPKKETEIKKEEVKA